MNDNLLLDLKVSVNVKINLVDVVKQQGIDENTIMNVIESQDPDEIRELVEAIPSSIADLFSHQRGYSFNNPDVENEVISIKQGDQTIVSNIRL